MQTNFDFLVQTDRFKDFAMQAAEAERSIAISPSTAAILSRRALELAVRWVYVHDDALTMPYRDNISSLILWYLVLVLLYSLYCGWCNIEICG